MALLDEGKIPIQAADEGITPNQEADEENVPIQEGRVRFEVSIVRGRTVMSKLIKQRSNSIILELE